MAKKSSTASKKTVQKKPVVKKKPVKAPAKKKVVAKAAKPAKVVKKKAAAKPVKKALAKDPKKLKAIAPAKAVSGKAAKKVEVKAKAAPMPKPEKAPKKEKAPKVANPLPVEEELVDEEEDEGPEEIVLTDAEGRRYCRVKDCDQLSVVDAYCRYHYLLFWKRIQVRKKILTEGKLERYIEELTSRYPDKFLDMLRKDLRSEKEFVAVIQELEIDESASEGEFEDEAQNYIDEVRGMGEATSDRQEEDF